MQLGDQRAGGIEDLELAGDHNDHSFAYPSPPRNTCLFAGDSLVIGPRQAGKTTLALEAAAASGLPFLYLDLASEQDRRKLENAELYLTDHLEKLAILDEVHRAPGLFPTLRGLIDQNRRAGRKSGQYLLLGSASLDLLNQSGESLAGQIAYLELTPFNLNETVDQGPDKLWVRGGFPESLLAPSEA